MAFSESDLVSDQTPKVLVFDIPASSVGAPNSDVLKRLSDRTKPMADAYDVARKHKQADDRLQEAFVQARARQHSKKVAEVGVKAVIMAQEKRNHIANELKEKLEKAETIRKNRLEDTRLKAKKVIEKHEKALSSLQETEQERMQREVDLQVEILLATEKRTVLLNETRRRAASSFKRFLARARRSAMENVYERKQQLLEDKIAAAAVRRAEERSRVKIKVARSRAREQLIQTKQKVEGLELSLALAEKQRAAEANRQAVLNHIVAKAAASAYRRAAAVTDLERAELLKAKIEAQLFAARERRRRSLDDTAEKAAAVVRKAVVLAAAQSTKEELEKLRAIEELHARFRSAAERHALGLHARKSYGLSGFIQALNLSPPPTPKNTPLRWSQLKRCHSNPASA